MQFGITGTFPSTEYSLSIIRRSDNGKRVAFIGQAQEGSDRTICPLFTASRLGGEPTEVGSGSYSCEAEVIRYVS
jgi:hypothetical protein